MYVQHVQPGRVVALAGRLDVVATAEVRVQLHSAVDAGTGDLLVDLGGVELLDAAGLGVIVGAHRRAVRAGRTLVLENVPMRIARLLYATRLDRVLVVHRQSTMSVA